MRQRVMEAVEELGYRPNAIARGLINQRSYMVAVIVANLRTYPEMLVQLGRAISGEELTMLTFNLENEGAVDRMIETALQYQVDGIIAAANLPKSQIKILNEAKIPVVFLNRSYDELPVSSVSCDQVSGERLLVDRLFEAGYRSFGILSGPEDSVVSRQRTTGAIDRIEELGCVSPSVVAGNFDYNSGVAGFSELVSLHGPAELDVVLCANDEMAIGCIDQARKVFGLAVPEDIAIVGFDGNSRAEWLNYDLVTITQPLEAMVDAALELVLDRVESADLPPERRIFTGSLRRGSSANLTPS